VRIIAIVLCWCAALSGARADAPFSFTNFIARVGFEQKLDAQLPLDAEFRDESGATVKLGDLFHGKPVVLAFVYYGCPQLCTEVMNGLERSLRMVSLNAGKDFEVVTISIDPTETPQLAAAKKANYLRRYNRASAERGWHCLTSGEDSIRRATSAAGFRYRYDERTRQYAHAAGLMIVTPQGRIARYFLGIDYSPRDMQLALVESSNGKIGRPIDQLLLLCYHYDPATGKYGVAITRVVRVAGMATVGALAAIIVAMLRVERKRGREIPNSKFQIPNKSQAPNSKSVAQSSNYPLKFGIWSLFGIWDLEFGISADAALHTPLLPPSAATTARDVDALFWTWTAISGLFALLIFAAIVFFSVRYRRRADVERRTSLRGEYALEIIWSVVPLIIALVLFVWATRTYMNMVRVPRDALEVYVVAKQWMWKTQHAEGPREINELHVPVGQPVKLIMTSQDVIHSFFIPAFRTKRDVLPGRFQAMWFQPTKPGEYYLFCAEYCGDQHSRMRGKIVVMEQKQFAAWMQRESFTNEPPAMAGEKLFRQLGCAECHGANDSERGPSLAGLWHREIRLTDGRRLNADEDYVRESIVAPGAKLVANYPNLMPTYAGRVDDEQLVALVEYVKSLRGDADSTLASNSKGLFPLTPALSPEERGNRLQRWDESSTLKISRGATPLLPLPGGEGWGEGEQRVECPGRARFDESGVALRLPPQSKTEAR